MTHEYISNFSFLSLYGLTFPVRTECRCCLQEEVIHSLNQELTDIRDHRVHHSQDPTCSEDHIHPTGDHPAHDAMVVQQLKFDNEGNGGGSEGDGERLVQLATQVEDLNYQLGTLTEELGVMHKRAEIAEVSIVC